MSGRVIVVGSVNVDLVVTVERLPAPGETVIGGTFERHHGGKGGNQAVAAARLGAPTSRSSARSGDDAFGGDARAALEAEGVDVGGLVTLADAADRRRADPRRRARARTASRSRRRRERRARPRSRCDAALKRLGPARRRRRPRRPRDPDRRGPRGAPARRGSAGATTILNPAPAGGLDRSTLGARRRPDARTAASSRPSPPPVRAGRVARRPAPRIR